MYLQFEFMKKLLLFFTLILSAIALYAQVENTFEIWQKDTINKIDASGKKQGVWIEFHESGAQKKRTNYVNDIPQGGETGFYKNGRPRYTIIWNQGVPHGFYQIYYASGFVKKTGIWRNDQNVGDLVEYYPSGSVSSRSCYNSDSELEGAIIAYHENEIIKTIELYERGIKSGFTIQFDTIGTLLELSRYRDGVEIDHTADSDELRGILDYVRDQNQLIFKRDSLRKQQAELELAEIESQARIKQQNSDLQQEKMQRYYLYGGLFFLLIFGGLMYNRFKVTQRQKHIIEDQKREVDKQKELIEETHKEITDSIAYAKRIQSAILPPTSLINENLKDSFVLYKPKDIVAGDFYWLETKDNKVFFAAADCTGHGVPGAMVSVICNNALNRSVREFGCSDPGKILDQARTLVIQEFEKSEDEVKDGMDIALCVLEGTNLHFSGANNPLWIIRNNELLETKADKQPIGKFQYAEAFTTHSMALNKGDTIYIFTDGFIDQFGGERGKKYKAKAFKELLLRIQDKTMKQQMQLIEEAFENWRGKLEQIDDVCVIGVRINK